jgi:hypothetical protein
VDTFGTSQPAPCRPDVLLLQRTYSFPVRYIGMEVTVRSVTIVFLSSIRIRAMGVLENFLKSESDFLLR